jgi:hypothetical protein
LKLLIRTRRVSCCILAPPPLKTRVLDVRQGETCQIIGTVYLDMPVKPNILEDIALDLSMPVPPPPTKIYSPEDAVYLEDESGRIKLSGTALKQVTLVTGIIVGVMGHENDNSEFEVIDLEVCGMPPQADIPATSMEVDGGEPVSTLRLYSVPFLPRFLKTLRKENGSLSCRVLMSVQKP